MSSILIATNSEDITVSGVVSNLRSRGREIVLYESDKVTKGETDFALSIATSGPYEILYSGAPLNLADVGAVWFRRPNSFRYRKKYSDIALLTSISNECRLLQQNLWAAIPDERWLNSPVAMKRVKPKLFQLKVAQEVGFKVPTTVVSNKWEHILETLKDSAEIVFKMPEGFLARDNKNFSTYTKLFPNNPKSLPITSAPYPAIWQAYIPKKREWRITVVGGKVFSAAIYTTSKSRDDWRRHQATPDVTFKTESFPKDLQKKCIEYLQFFNLRFGAFDFIENYDGEIYFLELNHNGQFAWLEDKLGLPISEAIADELIAICDSPKV